LFYYSIFFSKYRNDFRRNNDESNTKTRRLQSITNNNNTQNKYRTHTAVDSFVQLNLTPAIDIKLEDYKKVTFVFLPSVLFLSVLPIH